MKKLFIFLLTVFFMSTSYSIELKQKETSDIRVEIKSQIKVLMEKKDELIKKLSKATADERKEIKEMINKIDEKIKRLKKLIKKYTSFTGITG